MEPIRLQKYFTDCGLLSRRAAEAEIAAGRVKVNGIVADYETDGTYWAFYIGDEYGMTGVDMTEIEAGATYAFKVSK